LTSDQLAVYEAARAAMKSLMKADCSACRYCQPCPQGVQIPELLAALNKAGIWDTVDPMFTGYGHISGKPEACVDCGQCEAMCPQDLPIRDLLKEVSGVFGR
jgi:predicted aldo/keto reductase-like oxidoreductase